MIEPFRLHVKRVLRKTASRPRGGEITREKQSGHMVDALRAKAEAGHVHSGVVFGYVNHRNGDGHVERKIDPPAAKVVRRIFAEYIGGRTVKTITAGLNRDKALTPAHAGGWKAPKPGIDRSITYGLSWNNWNKQTVRGLLRRPIYKGVVISRWQSGETFEHVKPGLQIIDPATWKHANAMLDRAKQLYLRHTDGKLWGRPTAGTDSKYLLTGAGARVAGSSFRYGRCWLGSWATSWLHVSPSTCNQTVEDSPHERPPAAVRRPRDMRKRRLSRR